MACIAARKHVASARAIRPSALAPLRSKRIVNVRKQQNTPGLRVYAINNLKLEQPESSWVHKFLAAGAKCTAALSIIMSVMLGFTGCAHADAKTGGRVGSTSGFSARREAASATSSSTTTHHVHETHVVHTTSYSVMPSVVVMPTVGFGGYGYASSGSSVLVTVLAICLLIIIAVALFNMFSKKNDEEYVEEEYYEDEPPVTVAKLQVGLLGVAKNLRADLDSLAVRADTSSPEGLHFILQETVMSLLRNPSYCVYGCSTSQTLQSSEEAERRFGQLSIEGRSKFQVETLSNVDGMTQKKVAVTNTHGVNEMIVVTILVAAEAKFDMPKITNAADLKQALTKLGSLPASQVMAVELLWTPQADGDFLTQNDIIVDYPEMVPL